MGNIKPQTLKGFRDFLPAEARKRQYVINTVKKVFESYGFEPLETPALEYEEILTGKYGEEGDKLMYRFEDNGGRRVALRYDQTVPLSRVAAQYFSELPVPFKRYQIQPVWRAENTQKGRFREFYQCDADIVGVDSSLADAEVIMAAAKSLQAIGFEKFKILINDRTIFSHVSKQTIIAIDKLKKIGEEGVIKELVDRREAKTPEEAKKILDSIQNAKPTDRVAEIFAMLDKFGLDNALYEFSPTLARGLDYYTGLIFEIEISGYEAGSVCGGGRYNNLVGMFAGKDIPAVGFAFGFDRVLEAMEAFNLFPDVVKVSSTRIMVAIFNKDFLEKSIKLTAYLRENKFNAEIYDNPDDKLEKQLKYADKKGIMYVAVIGPNEVENDTVTLKNLRVRDQQTIAMADLLKVI